MERDVRSVLAAFGLGEDDLVAWQGSGLPDDLFDDWLTDRVARRPAGARAREVYGSDDVHDFARRALLGAVEAGPGDRLLDVGCGGGLLLRDALAAGAEATGLDHSGEMVALARERAPGAEVVEGDATALPFDDGSFTAVTYAMVLLFLPDAEAALREARRVLAPGGRLASYTSSPALRGTPAAPEPIATEAHFFTDGELERIARDAGFEDAAITSDDGGQLLTARR